ncbi:MAG TPA: CopD family protein [Gemmatimonadaceae bacterium]|nr:CopD family protein [Gemmatimonadaceae bacterium]
MTDHPLVPWTRVVTEYLGFLSSFAIIGAVAFRVIVLRPVRRRADVGQGPLADWQRSAEATAATIGLVGALLGGVSLLGDLTRVATEKGIPLSEAATSGGIVIARAGLLVLLFGGFALAAMGRHSLWNALAVLSLALALRDVARGRWVALVNPLHVLAASLWLGTLFVVVVAGVRLAMKHQLSDVRREPVIRETVNAFSRLALMAVPLLVASGVITAIRHLKYLAALWTTAYGYTFLGKMAVVSGVLAVGAWNWRVARPRLASENGVTSLLKSARLELLLATVVLALTAVLVSLPTPRLPTEQKAVAARAAP